MRSTSHVRRRVCAASFLFAPLLAAAGCAAPLHASPPQLVEGASPPVREGAFVTVGGHRIHYVERGTGDPVVLVHGFGGWVFTFRKVIAPLSAHYRVVAVDLLGFGLSDKPRDGDYSLAAEAAVLWAVLDSLDVRRPVLLGHSYGGGVVTAAALARPEKTRGVILTNSITLKYGRFSIANGLVRTMLSIPILRAAALQVAAPKAEDFDRIVHEAYARRSVVDSAAVDGFLYPYTLAGARDVLPAMARTAGAGRLTPVVQPARLRVPTLVMWGPNDPWFSLARGYQLAARIPGSSFALIRNAGHLPLEEQPEQCVRYIRAFMDALATAEARGDRSTQTSVPKP